MTTITSRHSIHASAGIVTNVCNALLKNEAVFPSQQTIYYSIGKLKDILHRGWAKKKKKTFHFVSFLRQSSRIFGSRRQFLEKVSDPRKSQGNLHESEGPTSADESTPRCVMSPCGVRARVRACVLREGRRRLPHSAPRSAYFFFRFLSFPNVLFFFISSLLLPTGSRARSKLPSRYLPQRGGRGVDTTASGNL